MFSKLRKLVGKDDEARKGGDAMGGAGGEGGVDNGMRALQPQLQRKFGRGVQYNMKIIIRGDKNVGKTCLWLRLQGLPFKEEYMPSEEIQVANIHWNFKASDDIVKVEIWDVVDKSKKRRTITGLKLNNVSNASGDAVFNTENSEVGLDAETLDVYKGTHGVILVMDLTKPWTFDYVKQEVERVPCHLPVLILVNHRDMGHHQAVTVNLDQVKSFVQHMDRGATASAIIVAESSMRNGFGLKYLHKFFNLPFLQLQRDALQMQLEQNGKDMDTTHDELESLLESEEQNYDLFIQTLGEKRRKDADTLAPPPPPVQPAHGPASPGAPGAPGASATKRMHAPPAHLPLNGKSEMPKLESKSGFFSKKSNNGPQPSSSAVASNSTADPPPKQAPFPKTVKHIDEFIPDEYIPGEFLEESAKSPAAPASSVARKTLDSSDEEDGGNPMVAGFTDEVELDQVPAMEYPSFKAPPTAGTSPFKEDSNHESPESAGFLSKEFTLAETPIPVDSPPSLPPSPGKENGNETLTEAPPSPLLPENPPLVASNIPISPIQFNNDEFSSWLTDVEQRGTQKVTLARKYSAGLVTATSLDESRIDRPTGDDSLEEVVSSATPHKKKSKKKSTKVKGEKSEKTEKKATTITAQTADSPNTVAATVAPKKVKAPLRKELSEADQHLVLERELEDFLASDTE